MNLGLNNKRVLITASTNGIGKAAALLFASEGAKVLINGRTPEKIEAVKKEIADKYGDNLVYSVCGDASDENTIEKIVEKIDEKWGALDILVPCIGTGKSESDDRLNPDEWNRMININLMSSVNLIHKCIPYLKKGENPAITMISSVVALNRAAAPVSYAAAKSGIITLNSYMAGEFEKTSIRTNCIVPGNVLFKGGRWEELKNADTQGTDMYIKNNVPMNRFGTPEEIANAIVFISSEKASFINGAVLTVDGGQNRSIV